jgi:sorbitol/mannitol transport system substrate-binding protein
MEVSVRLVLIAIVCAVGAASLTACEDDEQGGASNRGGSINVAIVDNPNTQDLAHLTPSLFTAKSHIKVNYAILDEGTLR